MASKRDLSRLIAYIITTVFVSLFFTSVQPKADLLQEDPEQLLPYTVEVHGAVTRVIDGDTVEVTLNGKKEKVRLIGIDTPEVVDPRTVVECFGKEASAKTGEVLAGKTVTLEADPVSGNTDRYGRLLRYVFLEDGTNAGLLLIREGYATEYTYSSQAYKYQNTFKQAEDEARQVGRGLWSSENCPV